MTDGAELVLPSPGQTGVSFTGVPGERGETFPAYLTLKEVAAYLGVSPKTVSHYRVDSAPGKRYAGNPFPVQDAMVSGSPIWLKSRLGEIQEWNKRRPGSGRGPRPNRRRVHRTPVDHSSNA